MTALVILTLTGITFRRLFFFFLHIFEINSLLLFTCEFIITYNWHWVFVYKLFIYYLLTEHFYFYFQCYYCTIAVVLRFQRKTI